jgi:hypothetical protein
VNHSPHDRKETALNEPMPDASLVPGDADVPRGDEGFTTAELLGNAALAIAALGAIWLLIQGLGTDIVNWIAQQLRIG